MKQRGDIVSKLSERGYRLTPQRVMVLSAIENSDNHISAEEIYDLHFERVCIILIFIDVTVRHEAY